MNPSINKANAKAKPEFKSALDKNEKSQPGKITSIIDNQLYSSTY